MAEFGGLQGHSPARVAVGHAEHVGVVLAVTGVENAGEFVAAVEEGIGFVDEERGAGFLDHFEEGRRADVRGREGTIGEAPKQLKQGGFAATFFRRDDTDVSGDLAQREGVGMYDPECECFGGHLGEDNVATDEVAEVGEDWAGVGGNVVISNQ